MKIFFRVDSSSSIGIGHLMRCLILAEALLKRGIQIHFICRKLSGNLIPLLQQKAFQVTTLPVPTIVPDSTPNEDYVSWLTVTQTKDAEQSIDALNGKNPDWLVVDHYSLDIEWEQILRPHVKKIMVIDDLANRRHDCDVLLDQNYSKAYEQRYSALVQTTCKQLLGPHYALLAPEYVKFRKTLPTHDGKIKKVFLFFGGTDSTNMTGLTLKALSHPVFRQLKVDVVIGVNNPHRDSLKIQAAGRPHTSIYNTLPCLAELMAHSDLAIGAGGITTWERMCLGLPTVIISLAENQRPSSEALAEAKLIYYAGNSPDIRLDQIIQLLKTLTLKPGTISRVSIENQLLVDGLGTLRLLEVMCPLSKNQLLLRPACNEDIIFYYILANDPEVRKNSLNTSFITWTDHEEWFTKKLNDRNSQLFVLEAAGLPVGQIRFDIVENDAHIDYSIAPFARGRGWGLHLISAGIDMIKQSKPLRLHADVKRRNDISSTIFLRMGFLETSDDSEWSGRTFYRDLI
jgi:UDP-2,4-diacetamido-2,4,6-trideoxy-beta-L-altropyranose hydrolase